MNGNGHSLFDLVPAVYRIRDGQLAQSQNLLTAAETAQLGQLQAAPQPLPADQQAQLDELTAKAARGPLQSLLMLIDQQLGAVANDLDQLYDDLFIETCAPWVIPYIGDLIGYQSIYGEAPGVSAPRSEVANTISFRRRKGTLLVLEQLARDVTGWGAHAVEFFHELGDTQYMKHIRPRNYYSPDVRGWESRLYRDSAFSRMPRKVDVHNSGFPGLPRPNIQNIGIFVWSLGAYSITKADAAQAPPSTGAFCYWLNPLGMDMPLFHRAISQGEEIAAAATQVNVPDRLRRLVLRADMQKGGNYYGEGASLALYLGGQFLSASKVQVADLSGSPGAWNNAPANGTPFAALVDPELGRVALPPDTPDAGGLGPALTASWYYGFNAEMGGGEYAREEGFIVTDPASIFPFPDTASPSRYQYLPDALNFVIKQMAIDGQAALEITNSDTYPLASQILQVDLPAGATLEFRAADGARPTLILNEEISVTGAALSTFIVNGLQIGASAAMTPGSPTPAALIHVPASRPAGGGTNLLLELNLTHCTLVPGWSVNPSGKLMHEDAPALIVDAAAVQVVAARSILGAIHATGLATVNLSDSILDATGRDRPAYGPVSGQAGGGALTLNACTVVGTVHAELLALVSDTIFWAGPPAGPDKTPGLVADRKQQGCARFSFLPVNAETPRQFQCVQQAPAAPQPLFISERYGHPGYLKMLACTDDSIRRGADDGAEMGAFHFVLAPQRESDLATRLLEYVPVGLQAGLIYQT